MNKTKKTIASTMLGATALTGGAIGADEYDLLRDCGANMEKIPGYHICVLKKDKAKFDEIINTEDKESLLKKATPEEDTRIVARAYQTYLSEGFKKLFVDVWEFKQDGITVTMTSPQVQQYRNEELNEDRYMFSVDVVAKKGDKEWKDRLQYVNQGFFINEWTCYNKDGKKNSNKKIDNGLVVYDFSDYMNNEGVIPCTLSQLEEIGNKKGDFVVTKSVQDIKAAIQQEIFKTVSSKF